jgi:mannosyl-3-phosphoglycerate phosphatase family protein
MSIVDPFIVEEGSAVFVPRGYFPEVKGIPIEDYEAVVLGTTYERIRKEILSLRHRYTIEGYCTMTETEVAQVTGLSLEGARMAKEREYSETVVEADQEAVKRLNTHFNVVQGGKFIQVFGRGTDKGKAVELVASWYRASVEVTTIGIGNAYNDEPMLRSVDIPALVRNPDGHHVDMEIPDIYRAEAVGPEGWVEVVQRFVGER